MSWLVRGRPLLALVCLLLICWFLFFYRLGARSLSSSHEARAAQNAASILQDGDWALPRLLNGRIELQKPPLYYWLVALLAQLTGGEVDAWAVRMPAALSALASVLLLYLWGWYRGRKLAGFLAAAVLATCVHFTWLGRVGRIDMPLTLAVCVTLFGFFIGMSLRKDEPGRRAWPWFLLGYLGLAAGVLLKGPIALVLPAITLIVFRLLDSWGPNRRGQAGNLPHQPGLRPRPWSTLWWGVPLVFAVAAPWFLWANARTNNQLFQVFFWYHNVERGLGGSETLQGHPSWFYGPRFFVDLLPWSLILPLVVLLLRKQPWWHADREARFGTLWLLTMLGFLSLMRFKRADYLLPAYPGAALLLGCLLERLLECGGSTPFRILERLSGTTTPQRSSLPRRVAYTLGLVLVGCIAGWLTYLTWIEPRRERGRCYERFAAEIRRRTSDQVIFFRTEAHELVFQVGRPLDTILEWENLDVWANRPATYFVMPPECARDRRQHLRTGRLEEVLCTTDLQQNSPERPLVLLRSSYPYPPPKE
jgi:4-amino-4-deoxy-L-arabinose transferase-like glycosyltransferase